MKSLSKPGFCLVLALSSAFPALALTVNDGSTITNLVQITNSSPESQGDAVVLLDVVADTNAVLKAYQSGTSGRRFAFRSAWYASDIAATGGVYTVTADFEPAAESFENRGGVMGWLSLISSNGITLQVIPTDPSSNFITTIRVSLIDFSANSGNTNDSFNHLFDTNGARADFGSALVALDPSYSTTNFATFQLAFTAPTAADIAALSNAAAHVTAKVFQGTNTGGAPIQVAPTIELLTDLPMPAPAVHRFGYFAVWGTTLDPSGDIGYLDNLTAEGAIGLAPNVPPAVNITDPPDGASFTEPANIPITANATDTDGTVTRVDFFAGTTLLGTATNSPFSFSWTNVSAGSYVLTAQAADNRGGTGTSGPVNVAVSATTGGGPTLSVVRTGNTIEISWPTPGYQLQVKTNLSSPTWTDVPNTVNTNHATLQITSDNMFFRLIQVGAPGGPALAIQLNGNTVTVSWPVQPAGYRLQAKSDLNTVTWTDLAASNNQFTETNTGPARFYRLIKP